MSDEGDKNGCRVNSKKRKDVEDGNDVIQKVRKKERWSEERKEAAKAERIAKRNELLERKKKKRGDEIGEEDGLKVVDEAKRHAMKEEEGGKKKEEEGGKKKEKKKKKDKEEEIRVRELTEEEKISGPGNADEAEHIRKTLGFVGESDTKPTEAHPTFQFGFSNAGEKSEAQEEEKGDHTTSDDSSTCSSESESESDSSASEDSSNSDENDSNTEVSDQEQTMANKHEDYAPETDGPSPHKASAENHTNTTEQVDQDGYIPRRIFVGGMPFGYTEEMVREYWEYCGPIEALDLMVFPDTGRFKGIAFITFATDEAYQSAIACDGAECDGQILKVQKCKADPKKRKATQSRPEHNTPVQQVEPTSMQTQRPPAPKTAGYNVAYVGNIAFEATPENIESLFEPYGVTKVRLHTDKDTGRPKGYAHVHFKYVSIFVFHSVFMFRNICI